VAQTNNIFSDNPFVQESERPSGPRTTAVAFQQLVNAEDLSVVFQPILRLQNLRLFAYEALMRCSVPEFSYPPDLFAKAVREGCCGRLGRAVRSVAMPLVPGLPVFVNVHPRELEERWLVMPDDPLFSHDHTVYLEITEAVPFTHFDLCRNVLRDVRSRADVRLVVDDLGAGYSNLKHIADLEPAVVKIDRALVSDVNNDPRRRVLIRSIVRMCADLGAEVVAEGLETADEVNAVVDAGVQYGQGHYFARPAYPLPLPDRRSVRP